MGTFSLNLANSSTKISRSTNSVPSNAPNSNTSKNFHSLSTTAVPEETGSFSRSSASRFTGMVIAAADQAISSPEKKTEISVRSPYKPIILDESRRTLIDTKITVHTGGNDAINVRRDNAKVTNVEVINHGRYAGKGGHSDAQQDIPDNQFTGGVQRGGFSHDVKVTGNQAKDSIQGFVGTDGCFVDKTIQKAELNFGSPNKIAYNGFANGTIHDVKDGAGNLVEARLQPLRVCGNPGTGNTWILSISPKAHECNPGTIRGNNYSAGADKRKELPNPHIKEDIGLCNFRMADFQKGIATLTAQKALANPSVKADVDSWINGLAKTQQPELKGRQSEFIEKLNKAIEHDWSIERLDGLLSNTFCKSVAKNYGNPCTEAK